MRPRRVVAGVVLIAALALVVVPAAAGSRPSDSQQQIAEGAFQPVTLGRDLATSTTTLLDLAGRSAGALAPDAPLSEPLPPSAPPIRPAVVGPPAPAIVVAAWHYDHQLSWYGPGFYGNRTACGETLTATLLGVANRTLPCGTLVTFRWAGRTITVPVVDRGPYVSGREWDLTKGACLALDHCWTGPIYWHLG
ncbi:MAG TPA: septal ring lytic transglycosylase RlpA family protein [Candidatus Limnocylindrales bacterium]|nr:septal ring lytic transglycosylase RlpA family protein [Candidatus Limnocylindrales bacterium]